MVRNKKIAGVVLANGDFINSKCVVSNCDVRQTLFDLLENTIVHSGIVSKTKQMNQSLSAFLVYLGIDKNFKDPSNIGSNLWFLRHYDTENNYLSIKNADFRNSFFVSFFSSLHDSSIVPRNKESLCLFINAPFKNKRYWDKEKEILSEELIKKIENYIPNLSKSILIKEIATPITLQKWTLNYKGAAYGWDSVVSQIFLTDFLRKISYIKGLFLVGHWTTQGYGIPAVAMIGTKVANSVLLFNDE